TTVGGHQFVGQTHEHGPARLAARGPQDPADGKALLAFAVDLHGHLIGGTADALGADLDGRLDVLDGLGEDLDGVGVRAHALADRLQRAVEDPHGGGFLAVVHEAVDELAGQLRAVHRVGLKGGRAGGYFAHVWRSLGWPRRLSCGTAGRGLRYW